MSKPDPAANPPATWTVKLLGGALGCYWTALFAGTHVPIDPEIVLPGNDKTMHFVGYAGLAVLFGVFLVARSPRSEGSTVTSRLVLFVGAAISLAIYGGFDELTQPLVGRMCDFHDWWADLGGIVIGLLLAVGASRLFQL